jgi:outer membrane lipopolysaccharide assembly protein LptE/RlpB
MKALGLILILVPLACGLASCGYHVAGKADLLPPSLHTISIPAFQNATIQYKLTDMMPEALAREFITRTRYRVVPNADEADMVLHGVVVRYTFNPTIFDPVRQRANVADLRVTLQITLTERATRKVLYQASSLEVKESYQISAQPADYFEESAFALQRASERVSRQVVTAILENF